MTRRVRFMTRLHVTRRPMARQMAALLAQISTTPLLATGARLLRASPKSGASVPWTAQNVLVGRIFGPRKTRVSWRGGASYITTATRSRATGTMTSRSSPNRSQHAFAATAKRRVRGSRTTDRSWWRPSMASLLRAETPRRTSSSNGTNARGDVGSANHVETGTNADSILYARSRRRVHAARARRCLEWASHARSAPRVMRSATLPSNATKKIIPARGAWAVRAKHPDLVVARRASTSPTDAVRTCTGKVRPAIQPLPAARGLRV